MTGHVDYSTLQRLAALAMQDPHGRVSLLQHRLRCAGDCVAPVTVTLSGRPVTWKRVAKKLGLSDEWVEALTAAGWMPTDLWRSVGPPLTVYVETRCRKCQRCLRHRQRKWTAWALTETSRASRTWFMTLTLSPEEQWQATMKACQAEAKQGGVFELLPEDLQFRARCGVLAPQLTRYVKRVRKNSGAPLKYLFVTERHKSGLPHFHALFHELDPARPLRKRTLQSAWGLGFSNCSLVRDGRTARYVCKYLAKEAITRVRSSIAYGRETKNDLDHNQNVRKLTSTTNTFVGD